MKKMKATITKKDGTQKEVFVMVDEQTAEMLEQLGDEKMVNDYLEEEYKMYMADVREQRNAQSLEGYMKQGIEIEDSEQDVVKNAVKELERETVRNAIGLLNPREQEIVRLLFYEEKTQEETAQILNLSQPAISKSLNKVKAKLKKFLRNF